MSTTKKQTAANRKARTLETARRRQGERNKRELERVQAHFASKLVKLDRHYTTKNGNFYRKGTVFFVTAVGAEEDDHTKDTMRAQELNRDVTRFTGRQICCIDVHQLRDHGDFSLIHEEE
jgi:hypothetical protein